MARQIAQKPSPAGVAHRVEKGFVHPITKQRQPRVSEAKGPLRGLSYVVFVKLWNENFSRG